MNDYLLYAFVAVSLLIAVRAEWRAREVRRRLEALERRLDDGEARDLAGEALTCSVHTDLLGRMDAERDARRLLGRELSAGLAVRDDRLRAVELRELSDARRLDLIEENGPGGVGSRWYAGLVHGVIN